jgi:prepilin-type N-terminal cleavage/methylation domain-containing protein
MYNIRKMGNEAGVTLLETMAALAIAGIIVSAFLTGLSTSSKAVFIADERASAENLARSQMEYVRDLPYDTSYTPASVPPEYDGYSVTINVEPLSDGNVQKVTVTVEHTDGEEVLALEDYKVRL